MAKCVAMPAMCDQHMAYSEFRGGKREMCIFQACGQGALAPVCLAGIRLYRAGPLWVILLSAWTLRNAPR